jgi:hypothetical protein
MFTLSHELITILHKIRTSIYDQPDDPVPPFCPVNLQCRSAKSKNSPPSKQKTSLLTQLLIFLSLQVASSA